MAVPAPPALSVETPKDRARPVMSVRTQLSFIISACILLSAASAFWLYQGRANQLYNSEVENNFAMVSDTLVSQIVSDVSVEDYDAVRKKIIKTLGFNQQVADVLILLRDGQKVFFDLDGQNEGENLTSWAEQEFARKAVAKTTGRPSTTQVADYLKTHRRAVSKAVRQQLAALKKNTPEAKQERRRLRQAFRASLQKPGLVYLSTPMVLKTGLGFGLTYGEENIGTVYLGVRHENFLVNERVRSMVSFAYSLTQNVAASVSEGDYVRVRDMMGNMVGDRKNIEYAELLHADGTILFYSRRGMNREKAQDKEGSRESSLLGRNALRVMMGRPLRIQNATVLGRAVLDIAVPVENEGKRVGVVRIGYSIEDFLRAQERTKWFMISIAGGYFLAGLLVALVLSTRMARPIKRLADAALVIGAGDLTHKVEVLSGGRETRELGFAFNQMVDGLRERDLVKDTFSRYVTKQVADEILKNPGQIGVGGIKKEVTILFSDIRGFTTFSERNSPEEVIARLNEYLSAMVDVIFKYEGTLDKYIGDAIMAVFGSPLAHDDDPLRAVRTAYEMQQEVDKLNAKWRSEGKEPIRIGIGVNTGEVIAGNIGDLRRMEYTVIGDSVNLAARIEGLTKDFSCGTIISHSTYVKVIDYVTVEPLEMVTVKGKSHAVAIYELLKVR